MPSPDAARSEISIYVEPQHVEAFRELLADESDDCLQLNIERVIGLHLAKTNTARSGLRCLRSYANDVDYGVDVAEVYVEAI